MMNKIKILPSAARIRANALLDMLYSPPDLAEELRIDVRAIYEKLIPAGMPFTKDIAGHLWLHGPEVARWVRELKSGQRRLRDDEVYCLRCRAAVPLVKPKRVIQNSFAVLKAICPRCGAKVNKGVKIHD